MNEKDFREVFSDKEFVSNLLQLETGERVRKALAEKGIVLSADELDKFAEVMIESIKKINLDIKSEKTDSDIENASGGVSEGVPGKNSDERSMEIRLGAEMLAGLAVSLDIKDKNGWFTLRAQSQK